MLCSSTIGKAIYCAQTLLRANCLDLINPPAITRFPQMSVLFIFFRVMRGVGLSLSSNGRSTAF